MNVWRAFLDEPHQLNIEAVTRAARDGSMVGNCDCGGYMFVDSVPSRAFAARGPLWVQLVCRACGAETAAPDGRLRAAGRRRGVA